MMMLWLMLPTSQDFYLKIVLDDLSYGVSWARAPTEREPPSPAFRPDSRGPLPAKTATSTTTADGPTVAKPTTSAIIVHDDTAAKSTTSAATANAQKPVTQGWKKKVDWKKFDTLKNQKDTKAIMAGSAGGIVKVDVVTFSEILVVMRINPGVSGWYRGMDNSLAFKGMMNFTSYPLAGQVDGQSMEFAHWRIMQDAEEAFAQGPGENLDRASITTVQDMAIKNGNNMPVRVGKVLEPTAEHPAGKQPKDFSKRTVGSLSSNFMIAVSPAAIACKPRPSHHLCSSATVILDVQLIVKSESFKGLQK